MKIRIYVMTHKKFEMPQSPLFRPLHVGCLLYTSDAADE